MFISAASRFLRLFITGVIPSTILCLLRFVKDEVPDSGILFLSFVVFTILVGFDAFRFSVIFWKKEDYFMGQLLPFIIYFLFAIMVYGLSFPWLLNILFLPLRFFECFGVKTIYSILISSGVLILIITVLRCVGAYIGKRDYEIFVMENTEV